ncbi:hypothetical protein WK81_20740 [Burkholderia ubonensis]|uniref:DUF6693 family protein n=1 Tax=Burkholderia ubonensis TaxID=101571 RepID=UPI000758487F|nr:DUF6693 family protein [Burkholderia ubonensis]KVV40454.1 hypothetical protein WK81_20740 [Burkholderia ubonensis]
MNNLALQSRLSIADIVGHAVIWILLTVVTLGLALFVYPYYLYRFVISKTVALDRDGKVAGRLECTIDLVTITGKIVIWTIITIVTFGIGYFFFLYKIVAHCMDHTRLVSAQ